MRETFRMWKIVRYLNRNQLNFISWDNERKEIKFDNTGKLVPEYIQKIVTVLEQNRDPRILRPLLAASFGTALYWKHPKIFKGLGAEENAKKQNEEAGLKNADAQLRISSCISAGFFGQDDTNKNLLYLSLKGKKFSSVFGLIKEWIVEDIGQLWSIIATIVVVIGAIKLRWLIDLIKNIL